MANKVFKVTRVVSGRAMSGDVALPSGYRTTYFSQGSTVRVFADFTAAEDGYKAVFLRNITEADISSLSTSTPTSVSNSANWEYCGSATVALAGSVYTAYLDIPIALGYCGLAAYVPKSEVGDEIQVSL